MKWLKSENYYQVNVIFSFPHNFSLLDILWLHAWLCLALIHLLIHQPFQGWYLWSNFQDLIWSVLEGFSCSWIVVRETSGISCTNLLAGLSLVYQDKKIKHISVGKFCIFFKQASKLRRFFLDVRCWWLRTGQLKGGNCQKPDVVYVWLHSCSPLINFI